MSVNLMPGIEGKISIQVTADKTAAAYGSGTVDVFATPAMVALMEQTAMESMAALLPEGQITVGTELQVSHLRATKIGKHVDCHTKLISISNRQLFFEMEAFDEEGIIGKGTHTRFIVDKIRFLSKL